MEKQIERVQRGVFDLDARENVTLIKEGEFEPVENTETALARVGNDAKKFIAIINAGLRQYFRDQLADDASKPWNTEDEEGKLTVFTGSTLTETQSKYLAAMSLNFAKMQGYSKDKAPEVKKALKAKAMESVLAMPGFIDTLKASTPTE